MYRQGSDEVMIALDAASGATLWEHRDPVVLWPEMERSFGSGPNVTPLLIGDLVVGIGIAGQLRALEAATGKLVWQRDLPREFVRLPRDEEYGYSGIPLAYGGKILVLAGGARAAVVAYEPRDGLLAWKSAPGAVSYGPPILTRLAGRDHYVYFEPEGVVALDPATGKLLWKHPIERTNGNHLTPAVPCDENHLWISSQFDSGGGRLLEITENAGALAVKELWFTSKLRAAHWPLLCRGEFVYGSVGGNDTSMLSAVRWRTGEIAWRERGFHKAQVRLGRRQAPAFLDEAGKVSPRQGIARKIRAARQPSGPPAQGLDLADPGRHHALPSRPGEDPRPWTSRYRPLKVPGQYLDHRWLERRKAALLVALLEAGQKHFDLGFRQCIDAFGEGDDRLAAIRGEPSGRRARGFLSPPRLSNHF